MKLGAHTPLVRQDLSDRRDPLSQYSRPSEAGECGFRVAERHPAREWVVCLSRSRVTTIHDGH